MAKHPSLLSGWTLVGKTIGVSVIIIGVWLIPYPVKGFVPSRALVQLEEEIKNAIARVRPAVVEIVALSTPANAGVAYQSIGSGVIVDSAGYILTNAHVIKNASYVLVHLYSANQKQYTTTLIDKDDVLDLALLRITENGPFSYLTIKDTIGVNVGDWVVAIGSPYGLEHSASLGIVSERGTSLWIDGNQYRDLIQTDASVNQGNSGGPLIDLNGEIVGINTAIYAPSGAFAGIGFAISASRAYAFINRIMSRQPVRRIATSPSVQIPKEKEPIRPGAKAPHPLLGSCGDCHTFIVKKRIKATPIAQTASIPNSFTQQYTESSRPLQQARPATTTVISWIRNIDLMYVFISLIVLFAIYTIVRMIRTTTQQ